MVHTFNPRMGVGRGRWTLESLRQPGLHRETQGSLGCRKRPCLDGWVGTEFTTLKMQYALNNCRTIQSVDLYSTTDKPQSLLFTYIRVSLLSWNLPQGGTRSIVTTLVLTDYLGADSDSTSHNSFPFLVIFPSPYTMFLKSLNYSKVATSFK